MRSSRGTPSPQAVRPSRGPFLITCGSGDKRPLNGRSCPPISSPPGATLLDRLRRSPVVVLTGARQVGKTTLVRSVPAAASRRFLTLDSLTTLDDARREPEALVEAPEPITVHYAPRSRPVVIR